MLQGTSATARSVGPGADQTRPAPAISFATGCGLSPLSVPQRSAASSPRFTGGGGDSNHGRQPNARNAALLRPKPSAAARVRIGARIRLHRCAVQRGFAAHHRHPFRSRSGSEWVHSVLPCSYAQPVVAADAPKAARRLTQVSLGGPCIVSGLQTLRRRFGQKPGPLSFSSRRRLVEPFQGGGRRAEPPSQRAVRGRRPVSRRAPRRRDASLSLFAAPVLDC